MGGEFKSLYVEKPETFRTVAPAGWAMRARGLLNRFAAGLRELIVPAGCLICDRPASEQGALCASCWSEVHFVERPYCEVLGFPFGHDHGEGAVSPAAIADPPPFDRLRCALVYGDVARRLVSGLKFSDRTDLAPWMARWMAVAGREMIADCQLLVPVPLHWTRLHQRRYNQSAELGRCLAESCGIEYLPGTLIRSRPTRRQVGLSQIERARNVQGAFRVPTPMRPMVHGRRVLLVDDVYTSGATTRACARALARAGAAGVDVLVFASVTEHHM